MANFNLNRVILGGRLTADPELKTTATGVPVASFTIAVNRRFPGKNNDEPQADFFNCTAWRSTAEFVSRYFRKASSICIIGTIQNRSWTDQQGNKRYATDIVVDEAMFVDSKSDSNAGFMQSAQAQPAQSYMPDSYSQESAPSFGNTGASAPKFEEITDDDDLPF